MSMTTSRALLSIGLTAAVACQSQTEAPVVEPAIALSTAALTSTLAPLADTYVRDGGDAVENFGSSTFIEVKQSTTFGLNRLSYLRFSLTGFTGTVHRARLRMWGLASTTGSVPVIARLLPDNAFAEGFVTYNDRPEAIPIDLGRTSISGTSGQWYEWDITALVREKKRAGDTSIDLQLYSVTNTNPVARFNSREATSNQPQLVVDTATALFVVGNVTLGTGDAAVKARLEQLGYEVTVTAAASSSAAQAAGKSVVVISSTCLSADVNTKFRDVAVPVVLWEEQVFDDMKLTGTVSGTDFGATTNQTSIKMVKTAHALAAGREGTVTVKTGAANFVWGKPGSAAQKIATTTADGTRWTIFGYDKGASMVGMTAPARRVGLFFTDLTAASLTRFGWSLFDAAVTWASGARPFVVKKVLVLNFDPIIEGASGTGTRRLSQHMVEVEGIPWNSTRAVLDEFVRDIAQASGDFMRYQVVQIIDLDQWIPFIDQPPYTDQEYIDGYKNDRLRPFVSADYNAILDAHGVDAAINNGSIDELFIAAPPALGLAESRMAGPNAYYMNSSPLFRSTNRNFVIEFIDHRGGVADFHEGYIHRQEWILRRLHYKKYGHDGIISDPSNWNTTPYDRPCSWSNFQPAPCATQRRHLWDRFTLVEGIARTLRNQGDTTAVAALGAAHYTPNAVDHQLDNYNWGQGNRPLVPVTSAADDWLYNFPNLTGETRTVGVPDWLFRNDHHRGFFLWFWNRFPRVAGRHTDGVLYNWWEYSVNLDDYAESRF